MEEVDHTEERQHPSVCLPKDSLIVFIGTNVFSAIVYYIWFPETNQLSLEQIAIAFGDPVAESVICGAGKKLDFEEAEHVEEMHQEKA